MRRKREETEWLSDGLVYVIRNDQLDQIVDVSSLNWFLRSLFLADHMVKRRCLVCLAPHISKFKTHILIPFPLSKLKGIISCIKTSYLSIHICWPINQLDLPYQIQVDPFGFTNFQMSYKLRLWHVINALFGIFSKNTYAFTSNHQI